MFGVCWLGILVILRVQLVIDVSPAAGTMAISGLLVFPMAYLILLWMGRSPVGWLVAAAHGRLPVAFRNRYQIQSIVLEIKSAEAQLNSLIHKKPYGIMGVLAATGLIWLLSLAEYWLAAWVLGARLDLWQTIAALTFTRLAFLTPLPGGLGALEAGQMLALGSMGFNPAIGLALSVWIRVRDTTLGLLGLWWGSGLINKPTGETYQSVQTLSSQAGD